MLWGCAFLVAAAIAGAAQAAPPPRIPAETFGRLPFIEDPKLSPDGSTIAAKLSVNGKQIFAFIPLTGGAPRLAPVPERASISWFNWANSDRALISLWTTSTVEGTEIAITRLVSASRSGGASVRLNWKPGAQFGDNVIHIPTGGGDRILMASTETIYSNYPGFYPSVIEIDVATGKSRRVIAERSGIRAWYADHTGAIRLGRGYDRQKNIGKFVYRPGAEGLFRVIDRVDYDSAEEGLDIAYLTPDPDKLVVISDGDGRQALYEYDIATQKIGARLWGHATYDLDDIQVRDGVLLGVDYVDDMPRTDWVDPELKEVQASIDKAIPAGMAARIVSMTPDKTILLVRMSGPTNPGAFYVFDRRDGKMRRLAQINDGLKPGQLAPVKPVSYKARDGLNIPGYLTLPVGRAPKNLPFIIMPHGGPAVRDAMDYDHWVQFLANRGYAVLQPNYRGSTGFGTAHQDAGDGEWGLKMQDDLADGVAWAVAQGIADPKRVCIVGGSYGGYAAMQGLVRDPDLYRCAVSFAGVSHMKSLLAFNRNFLNYKRVRKQLKTSAPDFDAISPVNSVDRIKAPLLLVHGKDDLRVPFDQSTRMYAAMTKAGKTVEFVPQEKGDHHLSIEADRIGFLTAMESFLARYNPAD
ncbi:MAG: S9 family peptidase [Alphaproteobacteria bacterium]|nr:S9 family peptidase [Alphaproteobacteria bacterium]